MSRTNIIKAIVASVLLLAVGFAVGWLLRDGLIKEREANDTLNQSIVTDINAYGETSDNNFIGKLLELRPDSLLLKVSGAQQSITGRYQEVEREVKLATDLELYRVVPKTEGELYGQETLDKIKELQAEFKLPKNRNQTSIEAISAKINQLIKEARDRNNKVLSDLSKQIIATDNPQDKELLMSQLRALSSDNKMIKFDLKDLKVDQMLKLYSHDPIDFNNEITIYRIEIDE